MHNITKKPQVKALKAPFYHVLFSVSPPTDLLNAALKRSFDICVASLAILATSPLMLMIAALIRLEGKGSIIFKQERTGQHAKPFTIYKFRTMIPHDVPDDALDYVMQEDPRITRTGTLLRNTSLDELPQLFNVLLGHLSIVGPRPQPTNYLSIYEQQVYGYRQRLSVRPGVTGPVQISPLRQSVNNIEDIQARTDLEVFYIRRQSFWLDAYICYRTAFLLLLKRCTDIRSITLLK